VTALAVGATAVFAGLLAAAACGVLPAGPVRRRVRRPSALALLLHRARVRLHPAQLVALSALAGVTAAAAVAAVTPVRSLALVPAALAAATPVAAVRRRARTRIRAIRAAWPDALAVLRGSVQSGRPLSHALVEVSVAGPPALRQELAGLSARIQTVGLVPALEAVRVVAGEPVTDRVVEVLVLAHAEGGRIVPEVLADLAAVVDAEVAAAEELDALALEGRLNARVVFALPWAVLVLLTAGDGPFRDFYASSAGAAVIALGAVLSLAGVALVARLSEVPEPPRVLLRPGEVAAGGSGVGRSAVWG
jgi:tight adherence protein B